MMSYNLPATTRCPYCYSTDIVTDFAAGDEICRSCAGVISKKKERCS